jgi:hypothetical protein
MNTGRRSANPVLVRVLRGAVQNPSDVKHFQESRSTLRGAWKEHIEVSGWRPKPGLQPDFKPDFMPQEVLRIRQIHDAP